MTTLAQKKANRRYYEKNKEKYKKDSKEWYALHKQECIERNKKYRLTRPVACKTLQKHSNYLKDDPNRLTTEFIQELIGIKCNNNNVLKTKRHNL